MLQQIYYDRKLINSLYFLIPYPLNLIKILWKINIKLLFYITFINQSIPH